MAEYIDVENSSNYEISKKEYTVDVAITVESKTGQEAIQEARQLIREGYGAAEADEVVE